MGDISAYLWQTIDLIFGYWPFPAAIVLGLFLPAMVVAMSGITARYPDHLKLTAIFAFIIIGSTLSIAFSGRIILSGGDLVMHPSMLGWASSDNSHFWFSRVAHLLLMLLAFAEILRWLIHKRQMSKEQFVLWAAVMAYYTFSVLISGMIGNFRGLNLKVIFAPTVFTAVIFLVSADYQKTLRALRWLLLFPLSGSLVAIWLAPLLVLETGYQGLIPGLTVRLAGLTEHANVLGVIAAIALFLELSKFVQSRPNVFFLLISGANLFLAQSKTAWIIAIVGFAILIIDFLRAPLVQGQKHRQEYFMALSISALFLSSIAFSAIFFKIDSLLNYLAVDSNGLLSFTGRTKIWSVTWNEFLNNPISGYGPSIWDPLYRYQHGMSYAGQAHNQFVQTFGQAGLLGIASLTVYIFLLVRKSYQGWGRTAGFSFLIVTALLLRDMTESPMLMQSILDFNSFIHLLAFASVAAIAFQPEPKPAAL